MTFPESTQPDFSAQKRRVALQSMLAAAAMTVLKLVAGLLSGSLGVLSDAAHSGLDMLGAAFTFFSVRVSDKPADEDHTYGHAKFENLSSFGEVILMALSSAWIIWEAVRRILHHSAELRHSMWPFAVVLLSIAVDVWRSRQLRAVADQTGSSALATDAFHFSSDIWSSCAVLAGLAANWVGSEFAIPALRFADPLAAIAVSVLILRLTLHIGMDAAGVLLDKIPAETRRRILSELQAVPGVLSVEQARVRRAGARHFVDLALGLPRSSTFEHTSKIVNAATGAVHRVLPEADVVVHSVPSAERTESVFDRVRAVAARNNVSVHDVSVQAQQGLLRVEQHLELDEKLPLREAHDFVTEMEKQILSEAPEIYSVLTHIESQPATIEEPEPLVEIERRLERVLRATAQKIPEIIDVHEIRVSRSGEHISLSCHCTLPDDLVMSRVHGVITALEDRFKVKCPEVHRVMIHPEPATDNLR